MMRERDEEKIIRCASPLLIYALVNIFVQIGYTTAVLGKRFLSYGEEESFEYMFAYNFSSHMQEVVEENSLLVNLICGIIMIPTGLYMIRRDNKRNGNIQESINLFRQRGWYYVVLMGIFASAGISKICTLLPLDGIWGSYEKVNNGFASNSLVMQILVLVIAGPITEEIIFRGLIYSRLRGYLGDTMAPVYISAVIFGIYHFNLVQAVYGFAIGILLCFAIEKYHTIWASIIMHISANLMALIMMHLPLSGIIEGNIYLKILFMIFETGALLIVLWKVNSRKEA